MSKNIDYKSEYWLYDQYVNKGNTLKQVAEKCGIKSEATIHYWMRKFNIQSREAGFQRGHKMHEGRYEENHNCWKGGGRSHYYRQARKAWEEHWDIPVQEGYIIHHVDRNIKNNDICNLVLLTWSEHTKIHWRDRHANRI